MHKTSIKGIFEMKKNFLIRAILWVVQGFIVGLGAILPGVSGGTLCYAFGIYDQIIEVLSNPFKGVKKHWKMLIFIGIGGVLGFVGFAGITERLLKWNEAVVLCVFVGLIAGTVPELWREAGKEKRSKFSILSLVLSFVAISVVFYLFKSVLQLTLAPNLGGWLVCGLLWGLSFIIPGFSSSTLLLFFGIYEQMSHGISHLDFGVLLPLGVAMLATLLLFSKIMKLLFEKYHSIASHAVMGFVLATTLMILPPFNTGVGNVAIYVVCILCGAVASFGFNALCNKIKSGADED